MERKLTAILSADVKGYSRLMGENEEATILTLTAHREVMSTIIQQYRGRVVDSPGDNLLAEFASVVDAVRCAVEIQQGLKSRNANLPPSRRMEFRIGINLGDVVVEGERIYGDGVNIAARLEGLAEPGGICISGTVHDHIENKLALEYEYIGEQAVKNIAKPVRVYRVQPEPGSVPLPTLSGEQAALLRLPDKPSIAVLPFVNLSSDPEQEYFSDGITEDLITDLSKLSGLFVIARNSVFTYKGKAVDVGEVSRRLGVRYIVEGSVRKAGNRVRITAQLIDATTGGHLWAERYDRELQDIFAVQDEVTQKIVLALEVKLTKGEHERLTNRSTNNVEAYDYYLRGVEQFNTRTKEGNLQARQLFERAIELDVGYAAAYAFLSRTYITEWANVWGRDPQTLERAFALGQKTVALDSSLPLAHLALGFAYLWKKQHEQAIAEAEKAIAFNPNDAESYAALGDMLNYAGRPEEAIELVEKAMHLDPHYPVAYLFNLGRAYWLLRRYEEAIAVLKRTLIRNPNHFSAHVYLIIAYSELDQQAEAQAEWVEVLRSNPDFSREVLLEAIRQNLPYQAPAVTERMLAAVHKAGLK